MRRLLDAATAQGRATPDELCDRVLSSLVSGAVSDDIALLAVRLDPAPPGRLSFRIPAEPEALGAMRRRISRWLAEAGVTREVREDVLPASSEASLNAIRHAYGPADGWVDVETTMGHHDITVIVRDRGSWRAPRGPGGRGMALMRACMATVDVQQGSAGTEVRMRRSFEMVPS